MSKNHPESGWNHPKSGSFSPKRVVAKMDVFVGDSFPTTQKNQTANRRQPRQGAKSPLPPTARGGARTASQST